MRINKSLKNKNFIWWPVVAFVVVAILFATYSILKQPKPREDMKFGVTFSLNYTQELGIDWQAAYDAILDDLGVHYIRLPIYWNQIEPAPGRYDFSRYDYMIKRAEQVGAKVTAVVGRRQPRWPECHVPKWAVNNSEVVQQRNIIFSIEETIKRYQDSSAIVAWQVDNEPLFQIFGICPKPDLEFLQEEIALVKSLDPTRPIQITDSGELSTWLQTAHLADQLGISMYRTTWDRNFGYFYYPLSPNFYKRHAQAVAPLVDRVVISELQTEPWFPNRPVPGVELEEQYRSMNPEIFKRNIDFARRTGFDESYLWGVEWWYWLKEKKNDANMWNTAKELFAGDN
jgi:beta-galactosidase GanA